MTVGKPDLLEVLRHYGIDVTEGRTEQLVLCPVHSEDQPSCSVNADKGTYNCHACGARGDSYRLIETKEGVDFVAAVEFAKAHFDFEPEPAGRGRAGLDGESRPARGGYRPTFRRRGLRD